MRERSERDDADESPDNVAWGQALYNITSGRPAAADVRETDYIEKIAQIQRAWATPRNIEVTKFLILWAADLA